MKQKKILFIDRDGTLIKEPQDYQVDSIDKLDFMPNVISSLQRLSEAGFSLVLVSNQDGLGSASFPMENFERVQSLMLRVFNSQNISFEDIKICPHFAQDGCSCRKPQVGLLMDYLVNQIIDRENSYVIGDRNTDLELAQNMGISGIQIGSEKYPDWLEIANLIVNKPRQAVIQRKSNETEIEIKISLDGKKERVIQTGLPFFDHMLEQLAQHGDFGINASIKGDIQVDEHHTVEDTALVLGQALKQALGDKYGIGRYGFVLPMDEAQSQASIDICGRPYLVFDGKFNRESVGDFATELVPHFFQSLSQSLGAAIHINVRGDNVHHMVESIFKSVGRCLRQAITRSGGGIPSTKGIL